MHDFKTLKNSTANPKKALFFFFLFQSVVWPPVPNSSNLIHKNMGFYEFNVSDISNPYQIMPAVVYVKANQILPLG